MNEVLIVLFYTQIQPILYPAETKIQGLNLSHSGIMYVPLVPVLLSGYSHSSNKVQKHPHLIRLRGVWGRAGVCVHVCGWLCCPVTDS